MVRGLSPGRAGHVLDDDRRIARNMLFQIGNERARLQVSRASGLAAAYDFYRLILEVRSLRQSATRNQARKQRRTEKREAHSSWSHRPLVAGLPQGLTGR